MTKKLIASLEGEQLLTVEVGKSLTFHIFKSENQEILIEKGHSAFNGKKPEIKFNSEGDQIKNNWTLTFDNDKGKTYLNKPKSELIYFSKDNKNVEAVEKGEDDPNDQPSHEPTDTFYRYCFSDNEWKKKSEINEVDLGGGNKTFNCNKCRKDLGETCKIFHCPKHHEEILKVWGTLEGENQEKVFFAKCPQEKEEQDPPKKPSKDKGISGGTIALIIIGIVAVIGGLVGWMIWDAKKQAKKEDNGEL